MKLIPICTWEPLQCAYMIYSYLLMGTMLMSVVIITIILLPCDTETVTIMIEIIPIVMGTFLKNYGPISHNSKELLP